VIQIEPCRCTATHKLDRISQKHVSDSNRALEATHKLDRVSQKHVSNLNKALEMHSHSQSG